MDIETLLDIAKGAACANFELEGEFCSMAIGFSGNKSIICPLVWTNAEERQYETLMDAAALQAFGADLYALIIEAWRADVRPSRSSGRRESVMVAVFGDHASAVCSADIIRHEDNTATLGDFNEGGKIFRPLTSLLTMRVPQWATKRAMTVWPELAA